MHTPCSEWRVPEGQVILKNWGVETLAFNALSGETHQLNELAATALRVLLNSPANPDKLTSEICAIYDVEDRVSLRAQLQQLLKDFDALGLVELNYPCGSPVKA